MRCVTGDNALTLTVTDTSGSESTSLHVVEDQAIDVRDQYWIRCLPHHFPVITVNADQNGGVPTTGWYLVNSATYAVVLDMNATPVWYTRGTTVLNVDALTPNAISFIPNATGPSVSAAPADTKFTPSIR